MRDLQEIILLIEIHDARNPTHGADCACLDKFIGQMRKMFLVSDQTEVKAQRRVDYVVRRAIDRY